MNISIFTGYKKYVTEFGIPVRKKKALYGRHSPNIKIEKNILWFCEKWLSVLGTGSPFYHLT